MRPSDLEGLEGIGVVGSRGHDRRVRETKPKDFQDRYIMVLQ